MALTFSNELASVGMVGQDKKRSLKGIFGVVVVPGDTATNSKNHRPVTLHDGCESALVMEAAIALQQLSVGHMVPLAGARAQILNHLLPLVGRHCM